MRSFRKALAFAALIGSGFAAAAAPLKKQQLTPAEKRAIQNYHRELNHAGTRMSLPPAVQPARPFSEVEPAGYLFFSADEDFDSEPAKRLMAQNLPADVTLVVYADPYQSRADILSRYSGLIDPTRLKVISLNGASRGFWSRDGMPVPVLTATGGLELVDARYYHGFEPDAQLGGMFEVPVIKHSYYFEGGNFMVNDRGDCLTVDNDLSRDIPESIFHESYGCQRLIRFPFEKGIGHMDESVRFLSSNVVVTDSVSYARILESHGFEVHMLPRPDQEYETYVNALLVNGTAFVPTFGETQDQRALDVYRAAGLNVVAAPSSSLSNDGLGSIHCITMTYPKVPFHALLKQLGAKEL